MIRSVARQRGLDDADDFEGDVMVKLVENNYAVLRGYKGESTFHTYIRVVVQNMALDRITHARGRWRPPVYVQRLGELAIELYAMLYRDGRTLEEAVALLQAKHGVSREWLEALAKKLYPPAPRPHILPISQVDPESLSRPPDVDDPVRADELRRKAATVSQVGSAFIARLPPEDQVILRFRYRDAVSVAQIARMLRLDQKAIYRRGERINRKLRRELARAGITPEDIRDLIGKGEIVVHFDFFGNQDS